MGTVRELGALTLGVGSIHRGDEGLHHSDWSHRWSGGPADEAGQATWQAALKTHMEDHQRGLDVRRPRIDDNAPPTR
ncbi:hypothetical protein [Micromonospora sp. WMMD710]|uniref:hypothetical protein n=1 Tax=Micromonospora sp. WMMD710 TaxID=3016085 RepID=UPI00241762F5|nr:hypothetical protein [Micromonospora sp. WMMD710]MDG4758145.1 hypothetical protein [Micromonospora sp. WMMD710]